MNMTVEQIVERLEAWVEMKRKQSTQNYIGNADGYQRGAASAQNVDSDEIMDIVLAAK